MFDFIRSDLAQFNAYTPNPGGKVTVPIDQLHANESPDDFPAELKSQLAAIYQQMLSTNRYPDGSHEKLKQVLAEYVNESASLDRVITPDCLSIGNGSDELIRSILIATCLGGEGAILVANPTFSMYEIIAKTLGISVVTVGRSETNFAIDLAAAQVAIAQTDNPPIRVVFVVHPNSPTANALTEAELDWLRSLPEQILVVIDEAYFEFSQMSVVGELGKHPNWVILRTFSKAFRLAAHRVGYAIADPEIIAIFDKIRLPYNLPAFSQAAALLALEHRELILPAIAKILSERDRLYQALSENPILQLWHSDANFIYLRLKKTTTDPHQELKQLTNALKAKGTQIRHTGGGLRITVGTPEENTRTIKRFQEILAPTPAIS